jgi:hypothetical protein
LAKFSARGARPDDVTDSDRTKKVCGGKERFGGPEIVAARPRHFQIPFRRRRRLPANFTANTLEKPAKTRRKFGCGNGQPW